MSQMFLLLCLISFGFERTISLFDFSKELPTLSVEDKEFLNSITKAQWIKSINFGTESVEQRRRQEEIILNSQIRIQNGSLSHSQLLDTLPNEQAQADSDLAMKILKSTLHAYTICLDHGIGARRCSKVLSKKELPDETNLAKRCKGITQGRRDGHHAFRRLLPRHYTDFFYDMYSENQNLPPPRVISSMALPDGSDLPLDDRHRNLALIQWAQFVEHDLSKPVVTSMSNGEPIECCTKENYNLLPRYRHTACAPLLLKNSSFAVTCLNYVRSALAVGETCTFGAAEQLNQATGYFDLSQLYGFTKGAQDRMRLKKDGKIKSSYIGKANQELLPFAAEESNDFCAFKSNVSNSSICFMAGDSRVNSNPFAITIYTIFLRNHNSIAQILKTKNTDWSDEKLYQTTRAINIDIYRRIVFNELLPELLGKDTAKKINTEKFDLNQDSDHSAFHISNEFAVAAIRFYYSMMPDVLYNLDTINKDEKTLYNSVHSKDQLYTPNLMYTSRKLDDIIESVLHQRAMKMDATYVSSLIPDTMGNLKPTRADILAFDIQRGRDHGIQPYFKYLETCNGVQINDWRDLQRFMRKENIIELQSFYNNVTDIDLIVGGIAETPISDGTVGPTFTCILGEQFSKIRKWHHVMGPYGVSESLLYQFGNINAANLICANTELKQVPRNIFRLPYETNPLISCADRSELQLSV